MANVKFKSIYTSKISTRSYHIGNFYSIFLALASGTSVAAWAIWSKYPYVWATIVAVSQVLHIIKPHILFIKNDKKFIEQSLLFESLYLEYEELWYENRKENIDSGKIEHKFYELRKKEHDISTKFKDIVCPKFKGLIKLSDTETNRFLQTNYK